MPLTTSEINKRYRVKHAVRLNLDAVAVYQLNKIEINKLRRERYAQKKLALAIRQN
jgi:hypothetical protein